MLATYPSTNFESSYPPRQIHHHSQHRQQQSQPQIQAYLDSQSLSQYPQQLQLQPSSQPQPQPLPSPPRSQFDDTTADPTLYSFAGEPASLFDFHPSAQHDSTPLMQADHTNPSWLPNNSQLTPTTTTGRAHHHRESSLSSLGSAGPASPYTVNIATPQIAGDQYHEYYDYQQPYKPLTPIHTPSQDQFLTPHYYPTNTAQQLTYLMAPEGSLRPSMASVASHDSPSTPPAFESDDRQKHGGYRSMPKLDRTMTDVYADELYSPNFQITSAPATQPVAVATTSPQNDVFTQRLQAANSQHLRSNAPLTIPARERSPFRQGSPLAPVGNGFGAQPSANARFGTATHMREQQKAENDARALQQQIQRTSPKESTPTTISPKDVDLVYRENEDDSNTPLFPAPQSQQPKGRSPNTYRTTPAFKQEPSELDDTASQQSFGSMATTVRRESSSGYSASSQPSSQQRFAPPAVPGGVVTRQIPQQYPFVPQTHREMSNVSNVTTASLARTETTDSSQSDYVPEPASSKKPAGAAADTGTYTCTYHGCTLRFETPAKLQRHKREGHRNSASLPIGSNSSGGETGEEGGMTSAAFRNTQNGPHKCERINPSTGKPCNTIFSRPYDLTRHEDTIHNARKQKVRCHLCTEEKTFSRNDALTRHFRVCHPEHTELIKGRRRVGRD